MVEVHLVQMMQQSRATLVAKCAPLPACVLEQTMEGHCRDVLSVVNWYNNVYAF